jgi:hypothetical protein
VLPLAGRQDLLLKLGDAITNAVEHLQFLFLTASSPWALANKWPHRPRLLNLPRSSLAEALDNHDDVATREAGFSPATCDSGLDVLGAVIDNRAQQTESEAGVDVDNDG